MQQYTINVVVKHEYPAGMEGGAAPRKTLREEIKDAKAPVDDAPQASHAKVDTNPKPTKSEKQEARDAEKARNELIGGGTRIRVPDMSVKPPSVVDKDETVPKGMFGKLGDFWKDQRFRTAVRAGGFGGVFRVGTIASSAASAGGTLAGALGLSTTAAASGATAGVAGALVAAGFVAFQTISWAAGIGKLQTDYYYERKDWNADKAMAQRNYEFLKENMAKGWYNKYSWDTKMFSWIAGVSNSVTAYFGEFGQSMTGIDFAAARAETEGLYGTKMQLQSQIRELRGTMSTELSTRTPASIYSASGYSGDIVNSTLNGARLEQLESDLRKLEGR